MSMAEATLQNLTQSTVCFVQTLILDWMKNNKHTLEPILLCGCWPYWWITQPFESPKDQHKWRGRRCVYGACGVLDPENEQHS